MQQRSLCSIFFNNRRVERLSTSERYLIELPYSIAISQLVLVGCWLISHQSHHSSSQEPASHKLFHSSSQQQPHQPRSASQPASTEHRGDDEHKITLTILQNVNWKHNEGVNSFYHIFTQPCLLKYR